MENSLKLITTWNELRECKSETHSLKIEVDGYSGWITDKDERSGDSYYLSTHAFYGSNYKYSTKLLQRCGFNVQLANWDE